MLPWRACYCQQHFQQALLVVNRTREFSTAGDCDYAGLFGHYDDDRIRLFRKPQGRAMARPQAAAARGLLRERQETSGGFHATLSKDRRAVVQWRSALEDHQQKVFRQIGV